MLHLEIEKVVGREIIDSRGNPTVEAEEMCIRDRDTERDGRRKDFEFKNRAVFKRGIRKV